MAAVRGDMTVAQPSHNDHAVDVMHFGPGLSWVGGIASVIRVFCDQGIGGSVDAVPTWSPRRLTTVTLAFRSVTVINRLPRTTIAHFHLSQGGSFVREGLLLALAHYRRQPTAVTIHGSRFLPFARRHPVLVAMVLRNADVIACLTKDAESELRKLIPTAEVAVVPNPVVVHDQATPLNRTREIVLFAGEVGVRKGADVLFAAWPSVARARPDARCIVVGPPTTLVPPALERLEVRPPILHDKVALLIDMSRVVVLPSRAEAMPMLLLEAMAAGRPFVATPVGQVEELARLGGVAVPVGDPVALAAAVVSLLTDMSRAAALGDSGREAVRAAYGVETVRKSWERMYRAIRARRRQ